MLIVIINIVIIIIIVITNNKNNNNILILIFVKVEFVEKEHSCAMRDYLESDCTNLVGHINRMKERLVKGTIC